KPHPAKGQLRVLLVDDNADLRDSLAAILQHPGCEIRTAPDGLEAVAAALEWRPHVAFVDIHMPGMNGFQVARKLREQFPPGSTKLILMSGVAIDEALVRDATQAGFDACIDKVAEPDLWLRHLEPALAGWQNAATSAAIAAVLVLAHFVADDAAGDRAADDSNRVAAGNYATRDRARAGADQRVFLGVGHARASAQAGSNGDDADGLDHGFHGVAPF